MNSHASALAANGVPVQARPPLHRQRHHEGPQVAIPGHGHRHHTHLAAGLRRGGYTTTPEDFSSCNPAPSQSRDPLK